MSRCAPGLPTATTHGSRTPTSAPMEHGLLGRSLAERPCPALNYIEMDDVTAKAAEVVLRQKSAHDQCSALCSGWELHTHSSDGSGE